MRVQSRRKSHGQSFLQGALVLTAGMALVKILGALFKIPLTYAVGEYGIGLFNTAYHFYGPVFSLATTGFPVAVSRLVSENSSLGRWNDARQVKWVAMPLFLGFGAVGMTATVLLAPWYCRLVPGAAYALLPMLVLAPAVLFACASSVYRGYYEGMRNMVPTAFSQILEALSKLGLGLFAAGFTVAWGREAYALHGSVLGVVPAGEDEAQFLILSLGTAAAMLGVTVGSLVSLLYVGLRFHFHGDGTVPRLFRESPPARSFRETAKPLLAMTTPLAVGSAISSVAGLLDATLLQGRIAWVLERYPQRFLAACGKALPGVYQENPSSIPTYLYGCYTLAMTVYLLVPGVTQALGVSALPSVTGAWARKNFPELRGKMEAVVRVAAMFCCPAGLGLAALSRPLTVLLYGEGASTVLVAPCLALLGIASLPAAMCGPLSSMLQAVGRADLTSKLLLAAMGIKLGASWVLCGIPEVHILGAPLGTLLCYAFLAISQCLCLCRVTKVRLSLRSVFLRPLACAFLCGATARLTWNWMVSVLPSGRAGQAAAVLGGILWGAAMYLVSLLLSRGIGKNDLLFLPQGQKIAKMLEKQGWI